MMEHWGFKMEIDEIPVGRAKDLRGQKFGRLTVLYRVKSPEHVKNTFAYWKCKCDCGNEKITSGTLLRTGQTTSCGCMKGIQNVKLILPGTRFGHLTVLNRVGSKNSRAIYNCQCDCGNTIILNSNTLRRGDSTTCGHCKLRYQPTPEEWLALTHEDEIPLGRAENLSGQQFGLLTALYRTRVPETSKSEHEAFWKCQCDCGNFTTVRASALKNGTSQSCGCGRNFRGEEKIQNILQDNNLIFIREKTFKDCVGSQKGKLRFDFYVNKNYLIEYDGQQHFYAIDGWGGKEQFQKTQLYDKIKNEYCKSHNIPLIRIPYWHYDNLCIEDLKLETSQFLI